MATMAGAGGMLQTILGLAQAVQMKRQNETEMLKAFADLASRAPDAATLDGLVSTFEKRGAASADALRQYANQIRDTPEAISAREFKTGVEEAAASGELTEWRRRYASRALAGQTPEQISTGKFLESLHRVNLPADAQARLSIGHLTNLATGMAPGQHLADIGLAEVLLDEENRQMAGQIAAGLALSSQQFEQLRLGWANLQHDERELLANSAFREAQLALQKAQDASGGVLSPTDVFQFMNLRRQAQDFLAQNRANMTEYQARQYAEMIDNLDVLLNQGFFGPMGMPGHQTRVPRDSTTGVPYVNQFYQRGGLFDHASAWWRGMGK